MNNSREHCSNHYRHRRPPLQRSRTLDLAMSHQDPKRRRQANEAIH
jgi:hypothetical protein